MAKEIQSDLFSQFIEAFKESVIVLSDDFKVISCNQAAQTLFANSLKVGTNFSTILEKLGCPFEMEGSVSQDTLLNNLHLRHPQVSECSANDIVWSLKELSSNGETFSLLIGEDISGHERLRESYSLVKAYLENVVMNVPGHIFWKDLNSVYLGCNDSMAQGCGLNSPEEIVGKTDHDLIWSDLAEEFIKDDQEVIQSGEPKSNIIEHHSYGNTSGKTMLANKVPLRDEGGAVIGVLGMAVDITEQKNIESILQQEKTKAEAASKAKSVFIANMSHDIRTPITGMLGLMQSLIDVSKEQKLKLKDHVLEHYSKEALYSLIQKMGDKTEKDAKLLISATDELLKLCNEILDIARLESGNDKSSSVNFDVKKVFVHNIDLLMPTAKHKSINLKLNVDKSVPAYLKGSKVYLDRILLNLISNGLKFTDKGFVEVSVSLKQKNMSKKVKLGDIVTLEIIVEDTGIGIPAEQYDTIFENFSRLSASYEGIYKGSGLGLYTVKHYLNVMRGQVTIESEVGKGTQFIISVPFQVSDHEDQESQFMLSDRKGLLADDLLNEPVNTTPKHKQTHVLVVEDNEAAAFMVRKLLENLNCSVESVATGNDALQMVKENCYDLVLMDVGLPDIDGFSVTKRIRCLPSKKQANVPVVALTGHAADERREECLKSGMNAILTKPADESKLQSLINEFVLAPISLADRQVNNAIVDWDGTVELVGGNQEFAWKMMILFREELYPCIETIDSAYAQRDVTTLRHELHKLLGGLSYISLPRLRKAVEAFHNAIKGPEQDEIELTNSYHAMKREVKAFCDIYDTMKQ